MATAQVVPAVHPDAPPVVLYPGSLGGTGSNVGPLDMPPALGVEYYYRQYKEKDYINGNFTSHYMHDPQRLPPRVTASNVMYEKMRQQDDVPSTSRLPWGRERSYAGLMSVNLPRDHRPKAEPPEKVEKGHKHFGSGINPFPRGVPEEQNYKNAPHILSNVRSNDELVPRPERIDLRTHVIKESFPADHPYASHINRTALLPNFDNPSDPQKGPAGDVTSRLPANPAPTIVKKKTFGSDKRHELQQDLMPSERKTVPWVTNYQDYYQDLKQGEPEHKQVYPTPMKALHPNLHDRATELDVSPRTANALRNCERNLHRTSYNTHYTGYGNMNALKLDNWEQFKDLYARNRHATSVPMSARSEPTFIPPRPLEGRVAKLLWQRGSLNQPELRHYTEPYDVIDANKELVDDHRAYKSLPEVYHEKLKLMHAEALKHAEYAVERLWERKLTDNEQKELVEERTKAMDQAGGIGNAQFMANLGERHQLQLKQLEAYNLWKKAKLLEPKDQMIQYRSQMNYVIPVEKPNCYFDHCSKIITARAPFIFEGENPYLTEPTKPYSLCDADSEENKPKKKLSLSDPCPNIESEVQPLQQGDEQRAQFKVNSLNFPQYLRSKTAPEIQIPMEMLGGTLTRTLGRPYSTMKLQTVRGRLEPNELKPEVKTTTKTSVMLDEKRLGAGVRPTFHNHPEELVVCNSGELDAHHIYRHNDALEHHTQQRAVSATNNSTNKQVTFKQDLDRAGPPQMRCAAETHPEQHVGDNFTWTREYNPGLSQSHFTAQTVNDDKYMTGMEVRPNYGLYSSIPKHNARLLQTKNEFNKSAVRKDFLETFPENAPDLRDHISDGKKHNFFGFNAYYFH
ncbi:uncharacterized protein LOC142353719 isoform X3 [Convolutriloba macropyga]|uniref:uncharacterized protein LOC142353719 isoform X3 n=1 Tax=Convolutriloba macropyga TaxID=536237 RepID=UPI003F51B9B3